jgi:hypothetical protein
MRKLTLLAAAAMVALGTTAATAQDTTRKESKGDVKSAPTVASIVMVVDGSLATAGKLGSMKMETPPNVEFVDVKSIAAAESDQAILKTAVEKNKDSIKQLQEELKKHPPIVTAINNQEKKPEVGDVIGAELLGEGDKLVLYFWKK